jgi:hypothetical protein
MYINAKMIPVETFPRIRGRGDEFKYDIFDRL